MKFVAIKNIFDDNLFWSGDVLNKEIIITNCTTHLNTVIIVEREINNNSPSYIITIKTVMRKKNFIVSYSNVDKTITIKLNEQK